MPPDDPIEAMRQALAAADHAARAIAFELEYSVATYPSFTIPTALLKKLDAWREAEAMLFQFLPFPAIPVTVVGPTQDQATRENADNGHTLAEGVSIEVCY